MKIKVNSDIIKSLTPCKDRLVNYLKHYNELNFDILEFLALDKITTEDKIWVSVRLMPVNLVERFALECSSRASAYAAKAYTYAAKSSNYYDASDAAVAASYAAKATSLASYAQDAPDTLTAAKAASYAASYAADAADLASAEEQDLQLKSIAQLIEESK